MYNVTADQRAMSTNAWICVSVTTPIRSFITNTLGIGYERAPCTMEAQHECQLVCKLKFVCCGLQNISDQMFYSKF